MKVRNRESIFVFGASGHGKVVIDIIERQDEYKIACLVDDNSRLKGCEFFGYTVVGGKDELLEVRKSHGSLKGIVAIGNNAARRNVAEWLVAKGFSFITAIHPTVALSRGVSVGKGTVVMAGAVLNADASVGDFVIVNTGATVDHDCVIGSGVHLAPGVALCGSVRVGEGTFVGAGTTVIPNITIGRNVLVGAGATVVRDVPDGVLVMGTPARVVSTY